MRGRGDFFLGVTGPEYYPRLPLTHTGEGNTLTIAAPGKGKTTSVLEANLISQGCSTIVSDFKPEIAEAVSIYRQEMLGIRSVIIAPFHVIDDKHGLKAVTSEGQKDTEAGAAVRGRIDPIDFIRGYISPLSAAYRVAEAFIPPNSNVRDPYWENGARNLFAAFLLFVGVDRKFEEAFMVPEAQEELESEYPLGRNMRTVALFLMNKRAETAALSVMMDSDLRLVSDQANAFYKPAEEDTGRSGVRDHLRHNIAETLGEPRILDSLSGTNVDFGTFVDTPQTAFFVLPGALARTHIRWLRLLNLIAFSQIESRGPKPYGSNRQIVRFHLDEFNTFGKFETITEALGRMRGYGVRFSLYIQALSQLVDTNGQSGASAITGTMDCLQFFGGTQDEATANHVSNVCGTGTVVSQSASTNVGPGQNGGNVGQAMHARLVKTKDEVMNMPIPKQLVAIIGRGVAEVEIIPPWLPYFPRYLAFMKACKQGKTAKQAAVYCQRFPETLFEAPKPQPPPEPQKRPREPLPNPFKMLDILLAKLMGHETT